jgi:hypothetical protein
MSCSPPKARPDPSRGGRSAGRLMSGGLAALALTLCACAPTVHVDVKPITIYAKLDADVRLRLDQEVKDLIQKNPNLF